EQVTEHLEDCVKAKTLMPAGCVFGYDTDNEIIGDISWSLERRPEISLTSSGNDLELTPSTVEVRVKGRYRDIVTAAEHDLDEKLPFGPGGSVVGKSTQVSFEPRRMGDISVVGARADARLWSLRRGEQRDSSNSPRRSDHKRGRSGGRGTVRDASGSAEVEVELPRRRVLELDGDAPLLLVELAGCVERDLSAGLTVTGGGASGQTGHAAGGG